MNLSRSSFCHHSFAHGNNNINICTVLGQNHLQLLRRVIFLDDSQHQGWPSLANAPPWGTRSENMSNKCSPGRGWGRHEQAWNWQSHYDLKPVIIFSIFQYCNSIFKPLKLLLKISPRPLVSEEKKNNTDFTVEYHSHDMVKPLPACYTDKAINER